MSEGRRGDGLARGRARRRALRAARVPALACLVLSTTLACEIEEITVVDVEDVVVAEVYVNLAADSSENEVLAFMHKTVGTGVEGVDDLIDAKVSIRRPADGFTITLRNAPVQSCVEALPDGGEGACHSADDSLASALRPGDDVELEISFEDGRQLNGATRIPGSFDLLTVGAQCRIQPDRLLPLAWSRSVGAWAYVNETAISGLPAALEPEGIDVEDDPLYLLGLSISDADTTTFFPSEFGVFNRFDLDRDLAVRLQSGIPYGAFAEVTITAVDRNYVNWARGGNFNPSGQVRVPSLRGDGTGVFGATVRRRTIVTTEPSPSGTVPPCPTDASRESVGPAQPSSGTT